MTADKLDIVALEEELREALNAIGKEVIAKVLVRADTKAEINAPEALAGDCRQALRDGRQ